MLSIVLIPGFMADHTLWDDVAPHLRTLGAVSYGDTTTGATIAEMAEHILASAPERFAVVGFSMGGYVAREIARMAPERVLALALVATSARGDTKEYARRKTAAAKAADPARFKGLSRSAVTRSLHPDRAGDDAKIGRIQGMARRLGGEVFVRQASEVRESDLDRLAAIRCPTLIVAADADALRSLEEARELRDGIAGARLTVIAGSGHMIPIEKPAELAAAIVPWLTENALK